MTTSGTVGGGLPDATDSAYTPLTTAATSGADAGIAPTFNQLYAQTNEKLQFRGRQTSTTLQRVWIGMAANTSPHEWEIAFSGGNYVFKIDGSQVCSIGTNIPVGQNISTFFSVRTLENASKALRFYGKYGEADR